MIIDNETEAKDLQSAAVRPRFVGLGLGLGIAAPGLASPQPRGAIVDHDSLLWGPTKNPATALRPQVLALAGLFLVATDANSQQAIGSAETRDLLVGKKALFSNGTMDFFPDGKVVTITNAGRTFRGTFTITDARLCRDYGTDGGRKCYRVTRDNRGFAIVDSSNVTLRFSIVGVASDTGIPQGQTPRGAGSLPPAAPQPPAIGNQPLPNQGNAAGTHPVIFRAFLSQIGSAEARTISPRGTTIVAVYALQSFIYTHIDSGGEALLSYSPSQGWKLVTYHAAGAWDPSMLVSMGLPPSIADQLIAGRDRR